MVNAVLQQNLDLNFSGFFLNNRMAYTYIISNIFQNKIHITLKKLLQLLQI